MTINDTNPAIANIHEFLASLIKAVGSDTLIYIIHTSNNNHTMYAIIIRVIVIVKRLRNVLVKRLTLEL